MEGMDEMSTQLNALRTRQTVQQLALDAALRVLTPEQANDCAEELRAGVRQFWLAKGPSMPPEMDEALASEFAILLQRLAPIPLFAHSTSHSGLEVRDWTPGPE